MIEINNEYQNNGITPKLCDLLKKFAEKIIDNDNKDIFWNDSAKNLIQILILCNLNDKKEVSITNLVENSQEIEKTKNMIEKNIEELKKVPELKEILIGEMIISYEKTYVSVMEIIHNNLIKYN